MSGKAQGAAGVTQGVSDERQEAAGQASGETGKTRERAGKPPDAPGETPGVTYKRLDGPEKRPGGSGETQSLAGERPLGAGEIQSVSDKTAAVPAKTPPVLGEGGGAAGSLEGRGPAGQLRSWLPGSFPAPGKAPGYSYCRSSFSSAPPVRPIARSASPAVFGEVPLGLLPESPDFLHACTGLTIHRRECYDSSCNRWEEFSMKRRWAVRLGLLTLLAAAVVPLMIQAEVICNDIGNCTYCDYWNGSTYAGYARWCRPAI